MKHLLITVEGNPQNYVFCADEKGICSIINRRENKKCFRCGGKLREAGEGEFKEENEVQNVVDFIRDHNEKEVDVA